METFPQDRLKELIKPRNAEAAVREVIRMIGPASQVVEHMEPTVDHEPDLSLLEGSGLVRIPFVLRHDLHDGVGVQLVQCDRFFGGEVVTDFRRAGYDVRPAEGQFYCFMLSISPEKLEALTAPSTPIASAKPSVPGTDGVAEDVRAVIS